MCHALKLFVVAAGICLLSSGHINAITELSKCSSDGNFVTPNRWSIPLLSVGDKHYYLGIFFKLNWYRAAQFCRYHGMDLASISSKEENDELIKHLNNSGYKKERFWTSGTDLGMEGSFFWMSNGRPLSFTDWIPGQPDNSKWGTGEYEHCFELWNHADKGLKWNDNPCSNAQYFICEIIY